MEKFLIFIDAADDAAMYPVSRLLGVTCAADTTILMQFASGVAGGHGAGGTEGDTITLTITAGTEVAVMKAIARAVAQAANASPHVNGIVDVIDVDNAIYFNELKTISSDSGFDIVVTLDT